MIAIAFFERNGVWGVAILKNNFCIARMVVAAPARTWIIRVPQIHALASAATA